ncbi:MAG: hypothetical protein ABW221_06150 [Vicinamibacteria bacterium]
MRLVGVALLVAVVGAGGAEPVAASPGDPTFVHEDQFVGRGEPYGRPHFRFGSATALSGDTLLVGVPADSAADDKAVGAVSVLVRSGTTWTERQRLRVADGDEGDRFGASVAISGDTAVIGAPRRQTPSGMFAGAVYVFERTGGVWTERQRLFSPDGVHHDQFGSAVAIQGDTMVVGAPSWYSGNVDPGSAYTFTRTGGTWSWQQTLVPAGAAGGDTFGAAVAISGDTIAVTAPLDDTTAGMDAGSAHVFVRSGSAWTEQQALFAPDASIYAGFGQTVALTGDTLAVGAYTVFSAPVPVTGGVYVFGRTGAVWSLGQTLHSADQTAGDGFGSAVVLEGSRMVVGAPWSAGAAPRTGAAYVFAISGATWTQQQKLGAADAQEFDGLGTAIALSGDTIVAGVPGDDLPDRQEAGTVVAFVRAGGPWTEQQKIVDSDGPGGDVLGYSVALSGGTLVVGAPQDSSEAALYAGSAAVYERQPAGWVERQKLRRAVPAQRDSFGFAVAVSGETAVIGARGDALIPGSGSATVFRRANGSWAEQAHLEAPAPIPNDGFGVAVAVSGDTLAVSAPGADTHQPRSGAVFVYVRSGAAWTLQQQVAPPDAHMNGGFGGAVAIEGDTLVVGAPADSTTEPYSGSTYVFVRSGGVWTQQQKITLAAPTNADRFGGAVSVSGNTAVIGAPAEIDGVLGVGRVRVYVRSGSTWTLQQKVGPTDAATFGFGRSVSVSGDVAVVGTDPSNGGGSGGLPGSVHVFERSRTTWTPRPQLQAPDGSDGDQFGFAVAVSGDTVAAGAYRDTVDGEAYAGSAHVFRADSADLAVTVTNGQDTVAPGETFAYTLVASNLGPQAVAGATVADVVPPGLTGATWTCVATPGSSCTASGAGNLSDAVTLASGGSATYTLTATVSASSGAIVNTATVTPAAGVFDANAANNSATDVDPLVPRVDLGVTLADSADPVSSGDALRYTASLSNAGPSAASAVSLVQTLPPGVAFVASSPGAPTCVLSGRELSCALGAMTAGAGASVTVDVSVSASPGGVLVSRAAVTSAEDDANASNDSAWADTIVRGAEGELAHGGVVRGDLAAVPGPAADEDRFLIVQAPHASYEIVLDAASGDLGAGSGPFLERVGPDGTTVLQGSSPTGPGPGRTLRWRNTSASEVRDETIRVRSAGCGSDCGPDDVYRLRAYETTLAVPRFNNVGSQATALLLSNPTAEVVAGEISFLDGSGTRLSAHPFSLAPKATLALDTRTLVPGLSGSITVAHDGGYAALVGKAVALDPAGGFSFDAALGSRPR